MEKGNKIINTRHIQLFVDFPSEEKEKFHNAYRKLYDWQRIVFKAANLTATNLYIQDQIKELFYFHDDVQVKLADRSKNAEGVFTCSRENTLYRILSGKFKSEIPASILSLVGRSVNQYYMAEKSEYFEGKRSLRSYKSTIPVPFRAKSIFNLRYDEEIKNFRFSLFHDEKYHIPFRTYLGRDGNDNRVILERCIKGEYKICDSFYALKKKGKIFLYLVVEMPKEKKEVSPENEASTKLSFHAPLVVSYMDKEHLIGDKESYIYKRLAIQNGLRRRQHQMKYNKGGKGRANKTKGIKEFKEKEKNFINTYTHNLSHELVKFCIDNKIGKLVIEAIKQTKEEAMKYPLVIRNWSFGNLIDKLKYKCNKYNIELILS